MSDASLDRKFYVSFGVVMSIQHTDVERVRAAIEGAGGKIVFQTISTGTLYLLRQRQVEEILSGDLSQLCEVHKKKQDQRRLEKK
jgi:hypothetical protein